MGQRRRRARHRGRRRQAGSGQWMGHHAPGRWTVAPHDLRLSGGLYVNQDIHRPGGAPGRLLACRLDRSSPYPARVFGVPVRRTGPRLTRPLRLVALSRRVASPRSAPAASTLTNRTIEAMGLASMVDPLFVRRVLDFVLQHLGLHGQADYVEDYQAQRRGCLRRHPSNVGSQPGRPHLHCLKSPPTTIRRGV